MKHEKVAMRATEQSTRTAKDLNPHFTNSMKRQLGHSAIRAYPNASAVELARIAGLSVTYIYTLRRELTESKPDSRRAARIAIGRLEAALSRLGLVETGLPHISAIKAILNAMNRDG